MPQIDAATAAEVPVDAAMPGHVEAALTVGGVDPDAPEDRVSQVH